MRYDMGIVRDFTGLSRHDISNLINQGMAYPKMMELSKKFYEKEDLIMCKIIATLYKFGFNPVNIGYIMTSLSTIPMERTKRLSMWENGNISALTDDSYIDIVAHNCKQPYGMITISIYNIVKDIDNITYEAQRSYKEQRSYKGQNIEE